VTVAHSVCLKREVAVSYIKHLRVSDELFAGRLGDSEEPQEGQSAEEVPRGVREPQVVAGIIEAADVAGGAEPEEHQTLPEGTGPEEPVGETAAAGVPEGTKGGGEGYGDHAIQRPPRVLLLK
jgi:hypothetical protein